MNFSRPFTKPRVAPVGGPTAAAGPSTTGPAPSRPGMTYGASNPAPPILTRPRAGASIINGQPPSAQVLAGAPGSGVGADAEGAADSITLGQMRANMQPPPVVRPKVSQIGMRINRGG